MEFSMYAWETKEIEIGQISTLLDDYEIQVDSPDGFVEVTTFVDKGVWDEYILSTEDGKRVRCNENHLFETTTGWEYAKNLVGASFKVLTKTGESSGTIVRSGLKIPIVDIRVDHPNHRYYTNEVSSHNTGVGKSLFMCHFAASSLSLGKNVLYITLEMAEERIAERIDANLMNVSMEDLHDIPKAMFSSRIEKIRNKTEGRLIVKEYPTASAHAGHFRALLNELQLKQEFSPDIIFIDYLNICASSRFKLSNQVNSYTYIKSIAEELRGLAVEFDVPIFSATQTTRSGFANSDVELTDTSESFGLPATADFLFALISTEDLEKLGQILVKQLKNRYNDISLHKRFVVGVDRPKMRLYDLDPNSQRNLLQDDSPVAAPAVISSKRFTRDFSNIKLD